MSGLLAVFAREESLVEATAAVHREGLRRIEAFTPYPVEALEEIIPYRVRALPIAVFAMACFGVVFGFGLQWYGASVGFQLDIGGRPLASWPAFIPIAFEIAVLITVLTVFIGFFAATRLPRLYQPILATKGIDRASQDRFVLYVDAADPKFDQARVQALFEIYHPASIELIAIRR